MKAQVSLEFLMLVILSGVSLLVFIIIAYNLSIDKVRESNSDRVKDFGASLQSEIILASEVNEGYSRWIEVPETIDGIEYSIYFSGDFLIVNYSQGESLFPIPPVSGSISKGDVLVQNVGGNVQVN